MADSVQPIQPAERIPNPAVVEELERLLEEARAGNIVGIAGVVDRMGREFEEFRAGSALEHRISFLAYLRVLQIRFEREIEF